MNNFLSDTFGAVSQIFNNILSGDSVETAQEEVGSVVNDVLDIVSGGSNPFTIDTDLDIFSGNIKKNGPVEKYQFPSDLLDDASSNSSRVEIDFIGNANNPVLEATLALYMPPNIIAQYTANWQDDALGGLAGVGSELSTRMGQFDSAINSGAGYFESGLDAVNTVLSGNIAEYKSRSVVNAHKALLYKSHNFRNIDLQFQLLARSPIESDIIQKITEKLKLASHPEIRNGLTQGSTFIYPDEFLVRLITTKSGNKYMFKFGPAVLTNIQITYGATNQSIFAVTGAPVDINLNLTFQEIFVLTKNHIKLGY